jgi:hypothetical protein
MLTLAIITMIVLAIAAVAIVRTLRRWCRRDGYGLPRSGK